MRTPSGLWMPTVDGWRLDGARENLRPHVNVVLAKWDAGSGALLEVCEAHNLAVTAGRNLIRDLLNNVAGRTGLNYFAVGTSATLESPPDIKLGAEVFRDVFTKTDPSVDGQLVVTYFLASGSANGNTLAEAGLFGNGATGAANTGTLYAHVTYPAAVKDATQAWTYTWTLTWG